MSNARLTFERGSWNTEALAEDRTFGFLIGNSF